jgi:hypothetical protein
MTWDPFGTPQLSGKEDRGLFKRRTTATGLDVSGNLRTASF